jgi:hypothetical protein
MPASKIDIYAEQGVNQFIWLEYYYKKGPQIDLSNFTAEMQVRRSIKDNGVLIFASSGGLTGGGITGEFIVGSTAMPGIPGLGGISLNVSFTGAVGYTGGISIKIDRNTMDNIPSGKHVYDLKLINNLNQSMRFIEGLFEVPAQVTRNNNV